MRTFAECVAALRSAGWLLAAACVPTLLAIWLHPRAPTLPAAEDEVAAVSVGEVRHLAGNATVLWIDARSAEAYAAGHIPGAIALREGAWEELLPDVIDAWQPGQRLIVYCDGGGCAAARSVAARLQRELATTDVAYLEGGWTAWQAQSQP